MNVYPSDTLKLPEVQVTVTYQLNAALDVRRKRFTSVPRLHSTALRLLAHPA